MVKVRQPRRLRAANARLRQVFTRHLAVPLTSNASEQTRKDPARHQAVSWPSPGTGVPPPLADYCRIRSYLTSTRNHGIRALDAVRTAPPCSATPGSPSPPPADTTRSP
jgi:transposase